MIIRSRSTARVLLIDYRAVPPLPLAPAPHGGDSSAMAKGTRAGSRQIRELSKTEVSELDREVAELAWRWARRLIDLPAEQAPFGPVDPRIPETERARAHLARLYVLARVRNSADERADADAFYAGQAGAGYAEIATALGLT
jgi:hypothetical protein